MYIICMDVLVYIYVVYVLVYICVIVNSIYVYMCVECDTTQDNRILFSPYINDMYGCRCIYIWREYVLA